MFEPSISVWWVSLYTDYKASAESILHFSREAKTPSARNNDESSLTKQRAMWRGMQWPFSLIPMFSSNWDKTLRLKLKPQIWIISIQSTFCSRPVLRGSLAMPAMSSLWPRQQLDPNLLEKNLTQKGRDAANKNRDGQTAWRTPDFLLSTPCKLPFVCLPFIFYSDTLSPKGKWTYKLQNTGYYLLTLFFLAILPFPVFMSKCWESYLLQPNPSHLALPPSPFIFLPAFLSNIPCSLPNSLPTTFPLQLLSFSFFTLLQPSGTISTES